MIFYHKVSFFLFTLFIDFKINTVLHSEKQERRYVFSHLGLLILVLVPLSGPAAAVSLPPPTVGSPFLSAVHGPTVPPAGCPVAPAQPVSSGRVIPAGGQSGLLLLRSDVAVVNQGFC